MKVGVPSHYQSMFRNFSPASVLLSVMLLSCGNNTSATDEDGTKVPEGNGAPQPASTGGVSGSGGAAPSRSGGSTPPAAGTCDAKFLGPFCEKVGSQKMAIIGFDDSPYPQMPTLADVRKFSVDAVNAIRARTCLPPLAQDECLNAIGTKANESVASLGVHGYFKNNCMNAAHDFGKSCECDWAQENYGSAGGSARTWKDGIIVPLCAMMEEPKGQGHRGNIESAQWKRMGAGVTWSATSAAWCHEFGR